MRLEPALGVASLERSYLRERIPLLKTVCSCLQQNRKIACYKHDYALPNCKYNYLQYDTKSLLLKFHFWETQFSKNDAWSTHMLTNTTLTQHKVTRNNNQKWSTYHWNTHVNDVIKKAAKRLYFLVQLKRAKVPCYNDLGPVISHHLCKVSFRLCDPCVLLLTPINELERVQKRALKIMCP